MLDWSTISCQDNRNIWKNKVQEIKDCWKKKKKTWKLRACWTSSTGLYRNTFKIGTTSTTENPKMTKSSIQTADNDAENLKSVLFNCEFRSVLFNFNSVQSNSISYITDSYLKNNRKLKMFDLTFHLWTLHMPIGQMLLVSAHSTGNLKQWSAVTEKFFEINLNESN